MARPLRFVGVEGGWTVGCGDGMRTNGFRRTDEAAEKIDFTQRDRETFAK
jgi:hypothetical protein